MYGVYGEHTIQHVRVARFANRAADFFVPRFERVGRSVRHIDHDVVAPGRGEELHVSLLVARARALFAPALRQAAAHAVCRAGRRVAPDFQRGRHRVQPPREACDARGPQRAIL